MSVATIGKVVIMGRLATRKVLLEPRHCALSARMALWVILVSLLARITSLPRAQRIASARLRSALPDRSETPAHLARTIDSLLRLDFFVFRPICWKRALVLHRFLRLNGIESRINFGVQRNAEGTVKGHAWLEYEGRPFLEHDAVDYVVTFSLPQKSSACESATSKAGGRERDV